MSTIPEVLRRMVTPFMTGVAVASATLISGLASIVAFATAAGLFGIVSHRAATRLEARVPTRRD